MPGSLDRWTSGSDYDRWMGRWSRMLAEQFLIWLDIPPGARWLDVCCGSGIVTELIAERCSPKLVVGIDASPAQIAFANEHRKRPGIRFEVGDAISLPFPNASFDAAVCGLGLNYISDPVRAIGEMRRVASDGVIAGYVWDYGDGARFIREFWDAAAAVDPEAANFDQAQRFPMCTADRFRGLFERAGCKTIDLTSLEIVTRFETFEDYWTPLLSGQGSAPNYLADRSERIRGEIRERLRSVFPASGPIVLAARAWAIRAKAGLPQRTPRSTKEANG
jgi:SAM-dependent methyltransferase